MEKQLNTLSEVKKYLRESFNDGCNCPACDQYVKLYKRKLYSTQARALIMLYFLNKKTEWVHVRQIMEKINISGDFAKLVYWELIIEKEKGKEDKKTSGLWKLTQKGKNFILNKSSVPKYVFIYNSKLQGFSNEQTTIKDALGDRFSYRELMTL